ncbi:MAG TPA: T9SS type A sorting domain-containing protein [Sphingobacteriaceae bacterium]|nr:T9SS type A sorting domain-containing protein [Sphingobacteriaceae bacterium]
MYDSYLWTCEYTGTIGNGQSTANVEIEFPYGTSTSSFWVECRVTSCGQSYSIHRNGTVNNCYYRTSYTIYPNPASQELNISFGDTQSQSNKEKTGVKKDFEVKIFNDKGKVVRSAKNNSNSNLITLNTSDIENGIYSLHIIDAKEVIKKQIIIQH